LKNGLLRVFLDQFFQEWNGFAAPAGIIQVGQEIFELGNRLRLLIQAEIQLDQVFTDGNIVRLERAELFEDSQGLAPVEMLHVDISHALEQLDAPDTVGAALLGKPEEAKDYAARAERIRASFNREFYHADKGCYAGDSQCANALPLVFGIVEPQYRDDVFVSLVRDVDKHPMKQRLIRSVTDLCRDQGITVIGEGVETDAEAQVLVDLGCDLLQGYLIAKPGLPFVDPL